MEVPPFSDPRWKAFILLGTYTILGITILGFSRKPDQIFLLTLGGVVLDLLFCGLLKGRIVFPLSALVSCMSLAILLNYSLGYTYLWLPVFLMVASKYIFTVNGKHVYNPSLFAICVSLWLGEGYISLAPSYQWFGDFEMAWLITIFLITGAIILFMTKINRHWLVLSFLFFYTIQCGIRAYVMRHHIPAETLFFGTLTSPPFYLFTFYMITDPATSPPAKKEQIIAGFFIAAFDLFYHTKFSLYTFFYAGFTVGSIRYAIALFKKYKQTIPTWGLVKNYLPNLAVTAIFGAIVMVVFQSATFTNISQREKDLHFESIPSSVTNITSKKGSILEDTDPRVHNVAKWVISVGDAVATADVNLDGLQDLFFTQILKSPETKAKLYLNDGGFMFKKIEIPPLEKYLYKHQEYGVPSAALFFDYDNDGDKDLFVGFGFGKSHLFENHIIPDDTLYFTEKEVDYLMQEPTNCMVANAFDFNRDGFLDLLVANVIPPYFTDYKDKKVHFNIFKMPKPEYEGDRRMFHFMHDSWHDANNGGENYLLLNKAGQGFETMDNDKLHFKETRWSLAIGTADFNDDGYTDIYIANDFGKDDCYLNVHGEYFERQAGAFYGELGMDTYKGMNASVGDYDGNLKDDVYISNVHHALQAEGSLLWLNFTDSNSNKVAFKERASQMSILNINRFGWGAACADINLDGWLDIVQANGMVGDEWDKKYDGRTDFWYYQEKVARSSPEIHSYSDKWADIQGMCIYENEPERVFLNNNGQNFYEVSSAIGIQDNANTRGVSAVDLDNDGDLDMVITDQFGAPKVYKNSIINRNWIGFEVRGDGAHCSKDAVGTQLIISYTKNGKTEKQMREVKLMNGFSGQSDIRMVFGLGDISNKIEDVSISIKWYGENKRLVINKLSLNKYHIIEQGL